jgi:ABC-2 type transport system permease protein
VEIYLLIGSTAYILVTRAFWDIAYWLRYEQQTGTLESLYLTPTSTRVLLLGVVGYSAVRSLFSSLLAFALGCLLFQVNPLQGNLLVAWLFILVGLVPVYALALLFGAVVVQVRESNALVSLVQWGIAFLMGVYYPIKMLPPLLQGASLIFPPTWLLNGVRSSLLGIGFFLSEWYLDLAVLWGFLLVTPLLSLWAFGAVEERARRQQGLGQY